MSTPPSPDVVSPAELAQAAGVPRVAVERWLSMGHVAVLPGQYLCWRDAIRAGRDLRLAAAEELGAVSAHDFPVLDPERSAPPAGGVPLALSSALHVTVLLAVLVLSSTGALSTEPLSHDHTVMPARLVYLATPGPGGGGGGGGSRQPDAPPPARREGRYETGSPVPPPPSAPDPQPAPRVVEPPAVTPVVAPVASLPSDPETRPGVLESTEETSLSRGSGSDAGTGRGRGAGMGEGSGPGIGAGTGGGTGGGVYRPGSGVDPPQLLREVKADYTDEARRRGVDGEVVFEIVVRRDGSVGDVRMLQGLGYGLDQRAAFALRQWRFAPAMRQGVPVDVLVEVSVEFRLR